MFRKIVAPLDGTALAEQILPFVRQITVPDKSEIELVCNLAELPGPPLPHEQDELGANIDHVYGTIQVYLQQQHDRLQKLGYRARVQMVKDGSATEIVRVADEMGADLIAMATHGRSPVGRWVLGSVADEVLHATHHPMLLVRAGIEPPQQERIARILLPLDGATLSEQALPVAQMLASELGAQILLLQSVAAGEQLDAAQAYLQRQQTKLHLANVLCDWRTLRGEPAESIVATSIDAGCDLIVMATHARAGLDRYLHGSVAGNVLYDSSCPLLLVRGAVRQEAPRAVGIAGFARATS
ncbi:MAG: universal stress protein [Caldilineaceae bacterium]